MQWIVSCCWGCRNSTTRSPYRYLSNPWNYRYSSSWGNSWLPTNTGYIYRVYTLGGRRWKPKRISSTSGWWSITARKIRSRPSRWFKWVAGASGWRWIDRQECYGIGKEVSWYFLNWRDITRYSTATRGLTTWKIISSVINWWSSVWTRRLTSWKFTASYVRRRLTWGEFTSSYVWTGWSVYWKTGSVSAGTRTGRTLYSTNWWAPARPWSWSQCSTWWPQRVAHAFSMKMTSPCEL